MKKGIVLSLVLSFCFGVFALAGCGNVSTETLSGSYQKLLDTYTQYSTSFVQNKENDKVVSVEINFSDKVKKLIDQKNAEQNEEESNQNASENENESENGDKKEKTPFAALEDYNQIMKISTEYTADAIEFVAGLKDDILKDAQGNINTLNDSMTQLSNYIPNFMKAKTTFEEFFEQKHVSNDSAYDKKVENNQLQTFKKSFGELVSKTIAVSSNLANVVENSKLFDVVKESSLNKSDTVLIKEYIRAKLLPVFTKFSLDQVQNQLIWDYNYVSSDRERFEKLLENIQTQFEEYKNQFVNRSDDEVRVLSNAKENPEMSDLLNLTSNFFTEAEDFYTAASKINVYDFVFKYDYKWSEFAKGNQHAETYMKKMETFITYTLPQYMQSVVRVVYEAPTEPAA